jgi:hypothetical protein
MRSKSFLDRISLLRTLALRGLVPHFCLCSAPSQPPDSLALLAFLSAYGPMAFFSSAATAYPAAA